MKGCSLVTIASTETAFRNIKTRQGALRLSSLVDLGRLSYLGSEQSDNNKYINIISRASSRAEKLD